MGVIVLTARLTGWSYFETVPLDPVFRQFTTSSEMMVLP